MIVITGAAGFIGSAVACALNKLSRADIILSDAFGKKEKWQNICSVRYKHFIHRDNLMDFLHKNPLAEKITAIIHMGACSDTTEPDMDFLLRNNFDYSVSLCQWALQNNVRFIYASSAAVYGDGTRGFSDDDNLTPLLRPLNKYGFSKWMFDMWILENGLKDKVAGLRFFNVFGPNEYHKGSMASVLFHIYHQAIKEKKIRLFESCRSDIAHGDQKRDFVYIDNAVDIILFALDNPGAGGIFNSGTGYAHSFLEVALLLFEGLEMKQKIEYFPMPENLRARYQYYTKADMTKLFTAGYDKKDDNFKENVMKYVKNYLAPGKRYLAEV